MSDELVGIGAVIALIATLLGAGLWYVSKHPCQKYGPEHEYTYFVQVGSILLPETGTTRDCLARK